MLFTNKLVICPKSRWIITPNGHYLSLRVPGQNNRPGQQQAKSKLKETSKEREMRSDKLEIILKTQSDQQAVNSSGNCKLKWFHNSNEIDYYGVETRQLLYVGCATQQQTTSAGTRSDPSRRAGSRVAHVQ